MNEEDFKLICPSLYNAIKANVTVFWFYGHSIKLRTHSCIQWYEFLNKIENESYMVYVKFSFEYQLTPVNLN